MKIKPPTRFSPAFPLAMAIAAMLCAPGANAINYYWDTNAAAGFGAVGPFTWNGVNTFWNTDITGAIGGTFIASPTNADDLFINGGTTGTITLSGTQVASSLTFAVNVAKTLSGGTSLTIGGTGTRSGIFVNSGDNAANTISSPLILNSASTALNFTNAGTGALTIGAVTGSAASGTQTINVNPVGGGAITLNNIIGNGGAGGVVGLTINSGGGGGAITLSGANTYTGATNILAGTTTISNASTFTNTSAITLGAAARLTVNAANSSLAKLATGGGGSGVVAGSFLRYSQAQTTAGALNGPGTIVGTVELNVTNVNPNYTLDFGSGGALSNLVAATFTSPITISGNASIDSSAAVATYTTGGITASTAGTKTLNLTGSNTGLNTISSAIGDGSGTIGVSKGGPGTWILSGTNIYTGNTRVDAGTLQFTNQVSLYNNGAAAAWTKDNIIVGDGATLAFNIGGAGQFDAANVFALLGLSDSPSNGFTPGSNVGLDTTAGNLVFSSVIADTNSGTNSLGLTKLGNNTLTLDQDNTYTGRTIISAGTLQLGNGGTTGKLSTSSAILNNGNLTINRSDAVVQGTDFSAAPIAGTGSFTQAGAGTTTLNVANTFSGTTTVSAGVLELTNALALQNSAIVTTGAGTVTFTGFTTPTFGGLSGASGDLGTVIPGFGSSTTLTVNPLAGSVTYGGVISDGAGGLTLLKTGAGTQILTGANLYTGTTTINRGTLTIGNGTIGSLNGTTGTALTFTGTGTFNVAEAAGSTQGMGALTLSAGDATITSTGIAALNSTLTLASLAARPSGATANFTLATNTTASQNQIVLTSNTNAPLDNIGSNNQGIFFGTTEYARYDTTNNRFRAVIYGTDSNASAIVATGLTLGIDDATKDVKVSGNITAQTTASVNTLNGVATTMTLSSTAQVLSVNGILATGGSIATTGSTINLAGKIQPAVAGGELVINTTGNFGLTAIIQDNTSASSLTKSGTAQLTLNNSRSTYTGGTVVNAGTVTFAADQGANTDTFFGTGPVTFNPGTTMALNRTYIGNALTLNNATLTAGNSFNSTLAGTTTLAGISTISITGNLNINGNLTGTGGLIKTGATVVPVNGTNNYTGTTTISGGGLTFLKPASLYNADPLQWTKSNITVNNGGSLTLKVGGAGEFTITDASTIFGNLITGVNSNGLQAGGFFGVDAGTSGGSFTISTNLTNSTGVGGGAVGIRFFGNNSMGASTLELTGTNTYSGQTIIDRQGLLKVSSLNSVFTNAALGTVRSTSSSLGAPTSVATGTIQLGTPASFQGAGLIYTGTGETTDRVLSLGGGGGDNYRLDQSGTGLLKFISNLVMTDTRGQKNIVLQGSTAGTGEIAGVIPNATSSTLTTAITKSGTGTWTLSAANLHVGVTTVTGGALVLTNANSLPGGIGATGGLGALTFNGGVIGLGTGNFSRPLAAAGTIGAVTFTGAGGWAAYGADRTVNLGGASAAIAWGTASTGLNGQTLILSNPTATHTVEFQNPISLGGNRTVRVDNGAAAVDGVMSGAVSGAVTTLTKTGDGTLLISGTADNNSLIVSASAGVLILGKTPIGPSRAAAGIGNIATGATVQLSGTGGDQIFNGPFNPAFGLVNMSGGTLDLNGLNEGVNLVTGTGLVTNSVAATTSTLTLGTSDGTGSFGGALSDGSGVLALTKTGIGTQTLNGTNLYTGATNVSAGTLSLGTTGSIASTTSLAIAAGATFDTAGQAVYAIPASTPIAFGINAAGAGSSGKITAAQLDIANATVTYNISGTPNDPVYVLATYTTLTGGMFLSAPAPPAGYMLDYAHEGNKIALVSLATPYDAWATAKGLTGAPGFENGKTDDPDNDGKDNLYEFAFDGNPLSGINDGKIVGKVATVGGNQVLTLTLPVRNGAIFSDSFGDELSALIDGVYYRIEGDETLVPFADTIDEVTGGDATAIQAGLPGLSDINGDTVADWTYRTFRAPGTVSTVSKAFLRAKASETP